MGRNFPSAARRRGSRPDGAPARSPGRGGAEGRPGLTGHMDTPFKRLGRRSALAAGLFLPVLLMVSSLVNFPVSVILERDLELHGVRADGTVEPHKMTHGKRNLKIHNHRVRYAAGDKEYRAWITKAAHDLKPGDAVTVYYSPLFPRHAGPDRFMGDRWDDRLALRAMARLFIVAASAVMAVGFYRRYLRKAKKGRAPGPG